MDDLSPLAKDTISEVGNISLGASATALSTIINKRVEITTPRLEILEVAEVKNRFPVPCLVAEVNYVTGLEGNNVLLIKEKDARVIAALMIGQEGEITDKPMDELEISALQEAMNQMMGYMATSMSEMFARRIDISPPFIEMRNLMEADPALTGMQDQDRVAQISFNIGVEDLINSTLVQLIPLQSAREMAGFLLGEELFISSASDENDSAALEAEPQPPPDTDPVVPDDPVHDRFSGRIPAEPELSSIGVKGLQAETGRNKVSSDEATMEKLDLVKDLPMEIKVLLGKTRMPLGKLFALGKGGVIDLDGYADEPVELLVNGKLVARGEVVMVNDQLGVRITKMLLSSDLLM